MSTINKVILIGHLGAEIKMHHFEGGGSIGRLPLATNETWKDKETNEKKTRTDWHNLVFRNKGAELIEKYTKKGDKIYVEGKLQTREWTDDKDQKRYSTEINVRDFTFLQGKAPSQTQGDAAQDMIAKENAAGSGDAKPEDHDDLPF